MATTFSFVVSSKFPSLARTKRFMWGVWVSVSKASSSRILELWEAPAIENELPKFGCFATTSLSLPKTLNLKTHLYLRGGGIRPSIELEPIDHPLAIEQQQGISVQRVEEIAAALSLRH
jgi:hypothetical protein